MQLDASLVAWIVDFHHCTETCHLQRFSDDSTVVGWISVGVEREYRAVDDSFVNAVRAQ